MGELMDTIKVFITPQEWLEQQFWALDSFLLQIESLLTWKFILPLDPRVFGGLLEFSIEILSYEAHSFLDFLDFFEVCSSIANEMWALLRQQGVKIIC